MKIRLDPETGTKAQDQQVEAPLPSYLAGPSAVFGSAEAQKRVEDLILAALRQQLPRERELLPHEAQKLRPRHIAILMRIAGGMSIPEASERFRMTTVRINTILQHPDAIKIMAALQAQAADKLTDISARIQAYSNEMLSMKVEIARTTKNENLKDRIASDILDRAGYGPRRHLDVSGQVGFVLPAAMVGGLTDALKESDQIAIMDYRQYGNKDLSESAMLASGAGESTRPIELPDQQPVFNGASPADDSPELERKTA